MIMMMAVMIFVNVLVVAARKIYVFKQCKNLTRPKMKQDDILTEASAVTSDIKNNKGVVKVMLVDPSISRGRGKDEKVGIKEDGKAIVKNKIPLGKDNDPFSTGPTSAINT